MKKLKNMKKTTKVDFATYFGVVIAFVIVFACQKMGLLSRSISGMLVPMGFGQGTGQTLNFGNIYEGLGFTNGTAFGLSIAAIGFLVACLVGVLYLNVLKKTGKLAIQEQRKENANNMNFDIYAEDEAPLSESVDKMTIQFGFIFCVYAITYGFISLLSWLSETYLGNFGVNTLKPLFWGFNFLFGTLFAILVKKIVAKLKVKKMG